MKPTTKMGALIAGMLAAGLTSSGGVVVKRRRAPHRKPHTKGVRARWRRVRLSPHHAPRKVRVA